GPRVGVAYSWNDRTVVRAGIGLYYSPIIYGFEGQNELNTGLLVTTPVPDHERRTVVTRSSSCRRIHRFLRLRRIASSSARTCSSSIRISGPGARCNTA